MTRLLDRVRRLPFGFGVTVALSAISLFNLQIIARSLPVSYPASDYKFAYAAAQAGFKPIYPSPSWQERETRSKK